MEMEAGIVKNDMENLKFEDRNFFIQEHLPFIISTISKVTNRYVSLDNDDEFSIGLLAFNEAIDKYNETRGPFLPFAHLVISSRIKTFLIKENKNHDNLSIESLSEKGIYIDTSMESPINDSSQLSEEISHLKNHLKGFGFDFEDLVEEAPRHQKTRENAIALSEKVSKNKIITDFMYKKKRLPIKEISVKYSVTEKIIKRSKKFIITVVIIFEKNFRNLKLWIRR